MSLTPPPEGQLAKLKWTRPACSPSCDEERKLSAALPSLEAQLPCHSFGDHHPIADFFGQECYLAYLRQVLWPGYKLVSNQPFDYRLDQRWVSLWGGIGTGKTEIAHKFMMESCPHFASIHWVNAENEETLLQSFSDHALRLRIVPSGVKSREERRQLLLQWYAFADVPWLIVADNLHNQSDWWTMPPKVGLKGSILDVSRGRPEFHEKSRARNVGSFIFLGEIEGPKVFLHHVMGHNMFSRFGDQELDRLVWLIRHETLLLKAAASLIRETECDILGLLREFAAIMVRRFGTEFTKSVNYEPNCNWAMWELILSRLERMDPLARRLLNVMCNLDPSGIPHCLMRWSTSVPGDVSEPSHEKKEQVVRSLSLLTRLALIGSYKATSTVHELVRIRVQAHVTAISWRDSLCMAVDCLMRDFKLSYNLDRQLRLEVQKQLIPHVRALRHHFDRSLNLEYPFRHFIRMREPVGKAVGDRAQHPFEGDVQFSWLMKAAAEWCFGRGLYSEATAYLEMAQRAVPYSHETFNEVILQTCCWKGTAEGHANKLDEALISFSQAWEVETRMVESRELPRPNTWKIRIDRGIATCYSKIFDRERAKAEGTEHEEQSGSASEKTSGSNKWLKAMSMDRITLAISQHSNGRTGDATRTLETFIRERENSYGPEDSEDYQTGLAYYYLGNIKLDQEKVEEAHKLHLTGLKLYRKTLELRDRRIGLAFHKLGIECSLMKSYQDAIKFFQQALEIFEAEGWEREEVRGRYFLAQALRFSKDGWFLSPGELESQADQQRKRILGAEYFPPNGPKTYAEFVSLWNR